MPCYHPQPLYRFLSLDTGAFYFRLKMPSNPRSLSNCKVEELKRPCGQCIGCKARANQAMAVRCHHESLMHEDNCWVTFTVDDDYLEMVFPGGSLRYEPFQKFLHDFRQLIYPKLIRYYMCGEYGDQLGRPHYHAIIFGWYPDDKIVYKPGFYLSPTLQKAWPYGQAMIRDYDLSCADYVAGYVLKKVNGRLSKSHYGGRSPEFARMSLKPGLGEAFLRKYHRDIYRKDQVVLPGRKPQPVPRYYDKKFSEWSPATMQRLKDERMEPNPDRDWNTTPDRLAVRKQIHLRRSQDSRRHKSL